MFKVINGEAEAKIINEDIKSRPTVVTATAKPYSVSTAGEYKK